MVEIQRYTTVIIFSGNMASPQLNIRVPPQLHDKLSAYVAQHGTSKTEVMLSALAAYLGATEDLTLTQRVAQLETRLAELEALVKEQSKR